LTSDDVRSVGEDHRREPGVDDLFAYDAEILIPSRFILPDAPREGIVVNLPEHRLYYFPPAKPGEPRIVRTYPISTGKMDWKTPLGITRIVTKQHLPNWYPPESVRQEHAERGDPLPKVVPPGPDNPLGEHAMRLGIPGGAYLIHGTNRPAGVGMQVTHGCIRMYPEDIAELFGLVSVNTRVNLIDQTTKVGWSRGTLYVEHHGPLDGAVDPVHDNPAEMNKLIEAAIARSPSAVEVDWNGAQQVSPGDRDTGCAVDTGASAAGGAKTAVAEIDLAAQKTPRQAAASSSRSMRNRIGRLLAHRLLERAIDLLVRRVAAGLRTLSSLQRLARRVLGGAGGVGRARGGSGGSIGSRLRSGSFLGGSLRGGIGSVDTCQHFFVAAARSRRNDNRRHADGQRLHDRVLHVGCPRWLDFNFEPNGRLRRSGRLFPVRRTAERGDGTRYEIVDKACVSRESLQVHAHCAEIVAFARTQKRDCSALRAALLPHPLAHECCERRVHFAAFRVHFAQSRCTRSR
jgi:L,D-transpeptidase ErfK/SrfK